MNYNDTVKSITEKLLDPKVVKTDTGAVIHDKDDKPVAHYSSSDEATTALLGALSKTVRDSKVPLPMTFKDKVKDFIDKDIMGKI